ncbi:MAG TPA: PQQ-binding-like beta-propeller repeat protein [Vicinamibacterales bacterium]|nr:PQQ-binding-like beta-propeller repeat protein [Vicinamibacterales bacterium]
MFHLLLFVFALGLAAVSDSDWSRFRGPNGSGISETKRLPAEFGPDSNVIWKTELPQGYSSPIIHGNRIFLTALRDQSLVTIAVDRTSGKVLWERVAPRARTEKLDKRNRPAAASAATDGERVTVFFGDYGLVTYDVSGKELWKQPLGPFNNVYGMGASPVIVGDKVILVCDQSSNSFIAAWDKKTGKPRWQTARTEAKSGHSTPIVWTPRGGRPQLIVPGSFLLSAYDPDNGTRLWWVGGLSFEMKSTPVVKGNVVYINGFGSPENNPGSKIAVLTTEEAFAKGDANKDGKLSKDELPSDHARQYMSFMDLDGDGTWNRPDWDYYKAAMESDNGILAIEMGGSGDMTSKSVRWKYHRGIPQLPSPLIYENVLYLVNDGGGRVTLLDPDKGTLLLQGRLPGSSDTFYASPVAGDGKIYIASEKGKVFVLPPGPTLEPIAVNDLGDSIYATPALMDGRIYLRTLNTLYAFGTK